MAQDGDTIWGPGVNGKSIHLGLDATSLDIRAVRGPLTADYLRKSGHMVPSVYGDPGLLVGHLWERKVLAGGYDPSDVLVVPNLNDSRLFENSAAFDVLNPRRPLMECLGRIAASRLVVGSSLHAIIVAESFGIPARLIVSDAEPPFKYEDYYSGTGRSSYHAASSAQEAVDMGGEECPLWDPEPLLASFPYDLWDEASQGSGKTNRSVYSG